MANINNCLKLSHAELDLVVLAIIQACTSFEVPGEKRKRSPRCNFLFQSLPVRKDMFLHLCAMSYSRFRRLKEHYQNHGMSPRVHGNSKRLPLNTLPQAVVEDVTTFLGIYVEENAVLLPGWIPGYKSDNIKLLSSSETKMSFWRAFQTACETTNKQSVSYSNFIELWEQFHLDVVLAKPTTDLCFTCQQNTSKLLQSANLPESEKSACVQSQQEHLNCVQAERELNRDICKEAKKTPSISLAISIR